MNTPFIGFLIFVGLCILSLLWFFRTTLKNLADTAAEHSKIYAIPYIKCAALVMIAAGTAFREAFNPVTPQLAATFQWYDWVIKFSAPLLAGLSVLSAFLDRSFVTAQDQAKSKDTPPTQ